MTYFCDKQRHLVCVPYSIENLHQMAAELGIARRWFHHGASYAHYDIPKRRADEITAKCRLVRGREILAIVKGEYNATGSDTCTCILQLKVEPPLYTDGDCPDHPMADGPSLLPPDLFPEDSK